MLSTTLPEAKLLDSVTAFGPNDNCGLHKPLASSDAKGCSDVSALDVAAWGDQGNKEKNAHPCLGTRALEHAIQVLPQSAK